jgi:hypothetical protein
MRDLVNATSVPGDNSPTRQPCAGGVEHEAVATEAAFHDDQEPKEVPNGPTDLTRARLDEEVPS